MRRVLQRSFVVPSTAPALVATGRCSAHTTPADPTVGGNTSDATTTSTPTERRTVIVTESPLANVQIVSINNPPVNTLTSEVMSDLLNTMRELADPASRCRGVVLTSESTSTFSSGLDLNVFTKDPFDSAIFAHYWAQFQELFLTMHSYPLPLVAAINGHAPAAGCIMACACDYRVMAQGAAHKHGSKHREFKIGITAARAGFAAPPFVAKNLGWIVGRRVAEDMLVRGATLTAAEALAVGLVDEVVESGDQTVVAALQEVERYLDMPMEHTRWLVKDHMRRPLMWGLRDKEGRAEDCIAFAEMIQSPTVRNDLATYAKSLSKSKQQTKP